MAEWMIGILIIGGIIAVIVNIASWKGKKNSSSSGYYNSDGRRV